MLATASSVAASTGFACGARGAAARGATAGGAAGAVDIVAVVR